MPDAEAEEETRPVRLAFGLDRGEEIVDRLLLPAFAAKQLLKVPMQAKDVGGRVQPAELDKLGDRLFAQALDIERTARNEMPQPFEALRWADEATGAANVDLA